MRKLLARLTPLPFLAFAACAQYASPRVQEPRRPLAVSAYYTLGFEFHYTPKSNPVLIETAGIQGELTRWRFRPGVDLRAFGSEEAVHGGLVGPTVAFTWSGLRPYAEALFGANAITTEAGVNGSTTQSGVTSEVVVGLDVDVTPHTRWRMLEFSQGSFTGTSNSYPRTLSSGIVLHF